MCREQITLSKIKEICTLALPNKISTITLHIQSLVKIYWYFLKLSSGNENIILSRADNTIRIDEICPLAIPNQISTISMHTPTLVKIHWHLLKLLSGNEKNQTTLSNSVKYWRHLPISNPKTDFHNINTHTKFGDKSVDIHSSYRSETRIRTDGQTVDQREANILRHYRAAGYKKRPRFRHPVFYVSNKSLKWKIFHAKLHSCHCVWNLWKEPLASFMLFKWETVSVRLFIMWLFSRILL